MLKNNGLYISRMDMFDHDLQLFVHGFDFDTKLLTKYSIEITLQKTGDYRFRIADFRNSATNQKYRNLRVTGATIEFDMNYYSNSWSKWNGDITDDGSSINFNVINPDYDEIDGTYEFVSYDTDIFIPKASWNV